MTGFFTKTALLFFWCAVLVSGCSKSNGVDIYSEFALTFCSNNPPSPIGLVDRIECWKFKRLQNSSVMPDNLGKYATLIYDVSGSEAQTRARKIHESLLRQETKYSDAPAKDQYVMFVYRNDGLKIKFRATTYAENGTYCGADFIVLSSGVRPIDNAGIKEILFP